MRGIERRVTLDARGRPTHISCIYCGRLLPVEAFSWDGGRKYDRRSGCLECTNRMAKEKRQEKAMLRADRGDDVENERSKSEALERDRADLIPGHIARVEAEMSDGEDGRRNSRRGEVLGTSRRRAQLVKEMGELAYG